MLVSMDCLEGSYKTFLQKIFGLGRMVYKALEIQTRADIASIKEPTKGKKITPDEFTKERDKMMEEMRKNNQGSGNRVIRMQ